MSGSVNKVIIVGRVGRDPEIRSLNDGTRVANLSLATSESWRDRGSGERKERTEWHRISVLNDKLAEVVEKYVKKGALLHIEGQLQTRKWTDQSGQERYTTEIVLNRFRGELVMLGDTGGGRAARRDAYSDEDGSGPPDTPRSRGARYGSLPVHSPPTRRDIAGKADADLDDAIPFLTCDPAFEPYLKRRIIA